MRSRIDKVEELKIILGKNIDEEIKEIDSKNYWLSLMLAAVATVVYIIAAAINPRYLQMVLLSGLAIGFVTLSAMLSAKIKVYITPKLLPKALSGLCIPTAIALTLVAMKFEVFWRILEGEEYTITFEGTVFTITGVILFLTTLYTVPKLIVAHDILKAKMELNNIIREIKNFNF